jgi:hypothetical protein
MTTENAHCMHCRVGWNKEVLESCGVSKKFVTKTYKKRREDVLFERERSLMPETQPYVERAILSERLRNEIIAIEVRMATSLNEFYRTSSKSLATVAAEINDDDQIKCLMTRTEDAYKHYDNYSLELSHKNMKLAQIGLLTNNEVNTKLEARKFVRACPQNGCAGFLSTAWKCGVCDKRACPECHEPKEEEHTCKPECIETAKLLARDSKACPNCASLIFKIEGCDQMWCTQCTTAFSWNTGRVETGRIHNPHYYDYQRNAGRIQREIGDIPCGGMPNDLDIRAVSRRLDLGPTFTGRLLNIVRVHAHIQYVTMAQYTRRYNDNRDLRIKYMMKTMTEDEFKRKIQMREKDTEKRHAITNVLNTYQVVMAEIMQRIVYAPTFNPDDGREFDQIREYINDQMYKLTKRFQCVTPRIGDDFQIHRFK